MFESLRPQLARSSAFKNAEAPSEDTARSLAFSVSVGAFSTRSSNLFRHNGLSQADWKIGLFGKSVTPTFNFHSSHPLSKKVFFPVVFPDKLLKK